MLFSYFFNFPSCYQIISFLITSLCSRGVWPVRKYLFCGFPKLSLFVFFNPKLWTWCRTPVAPRRVWTPDPGPEPADAAHGHLQGGEHLLSRPGMDNHDRNVLIFKRQRSSYFILIYYLLILIHYFIFILIHHFILKFIHYSILIFIHYFILIFIMIFFSN